MTQPRSGDTSAPSGPPRPAARRRWPSQDYGDDGEADTGLGTHWARFDDADEQLISKYRWRLRVGGRNLYALITIDGREVSMHRLVIDAAKGTVIDHRNGDGLNDRRANLRMRRLVGFSTVLLANLG